MEELYNINQSYKTLLYDFDTILAHYATLVLQSKYKKRLKPEKLRCMRENPYKSKKEQPKNVKKQIKFFKDLYRERLKRRR